MYATLKPRNGTPIPTPAYLSNPPYLTLCRRDGGGDQTIFLLKILFRLKFFWTHDLIGPKIFFDPKNFFLQDSFRPKNFLEPEFFPTKQYFGTQFFLTKIFSDPKFFRTQIFLDPKFFSNIFGTQKFVDPNFFNINLFRPKIVWT